MLRHKIRPGNRSIGIYEFIAIIIIVLAVCLRISLIAQGWPQTDSDEATMGLMALSLLLGLFVALLPTIIYNFTVPIEKSSLAVLGVIVWHGQGTHPSILTDLAGTILLSLPTALGGSTLCGLSTSETWPLSAQSSLHTMQCTVVHGGWGVGFIMLWLVAFFLTIRGPWKPWQQGTRPQGAPLL